jgi:hypothetical protein
LEERVERSVADGLVDGVAVCIEELDGRVAGHAVPLRHRRLLLGIDLEEHEILTLLLELVA